MSGLKSAIAILGFAVLSTMAFPSILSACTSSMGTPVSWLRDSEAVVRVRALEQLGRESDTRIRFQVLEVMKGNAIGGLLEFEGMFTDRDDQNSGPVPYTIVRTQGRGGNCFAYTYRQGREYLLILGAKNGGVTPYWQTLAATIEQLADANDQWLAWVRAQLQSGQD